MIKGFKVAIVRLLPSRTSGIDRKGGEGGGRGCERGTSRCQTQEWERGSQLASSRRQKNDDDKRGDVQQGKNRQRASRKEEIKASARK